MADTAVVLGKHHWMLYWLVTAMYPQFLITMNEEIEEQAVTVRVGQAVNTIGQAGTRHGISGVSLPFYCLVFYPAGGDIVNDTDTDTAADIINSNTDNHSSKHTKRRFASVPRNAPRWARTSISRIRPCWRTL